MIVRLKVAMAGDRKQWQSGDLLEVGQDEAERLVMAGFAELVIEFPAATPIETAIDPKPYRAETRAKPKPKRK